MSIQPEESCRQTHINRIDRIKLFVQSDEFHKASSIEIEQKRESLENAYSDFIGERNRLIRFAPKSMFEEEDKKLAEVEEIYHSVGLKLRQQFRKREAEEAIERNVRQNELSRKNNVRTMEADSNSEETHDEATDHLQSVAFQVIMARKSKEKESNDLRRVLARKECAGQGPYQRKQSPTRRTVQSAAHKIHRPIVCHNCKARTHPMFKCHAFKALEIIKRRDRVNVLGLCENCLQPKEKFRSHRCRGGSCWRCGLFHNSLLCSRAVK